MPGGCMRAGVWLFCDIRPCSCACMCTRFVVCVFFVFSSIFTNSKDVVCFVYYQRRRRPPLSQKYCNACHALRYVTFFVFRLAHRSTHIFSDMFGFFFFTPFCLPWCFCRNNGFHLFSFAVCVCVCVCLAVQRIYPLALNFFQLYCPCLVFLFLALLKIEIPNLFFPILFVLFFLYCARVCCSGKWHIRTAQEENSSGVITHHLPGRGEVQGLRVCQTLWVGLIVFFFFLLPRVP